MCLMAVEARRCRRGLLFDKGCLRLHPMHRLPWAALELRRTLGMPGGQADDSDGQQECRSLEMIV
jgi:hypothetical protein